MPRDYSDDNSSHPLRDSAPPAAPEAPPALQPAPQAGATARYTWAEVWTAAISRPQPATYAALLGDPQARAKRALLWVYLASVAQLVVQLLILMSAFLASADMAAALEESGFSVDEGLGVSVFISIMCVAPFAGGINVLIFAGLTRAIDWLAKRQYGTTSRPEQALYAFGASTAPLTLLLALLVLLPLGSLSQVLALAMQGYQIWLYVVAAQALYGLEQRQAALVAIVPSLALLLFQFLLVGALL